VGGDTCRVSACANLERVSTMWTREPRFVPFPRFSITARPGRNPPFWAVKQLARPYKTATESRFTLENAKGA
jgi:hypothetical protein